MKNILISVFMLITFSAFSQGGLLKPRYIGWPVDSFQNLTLKWNPSTFKAEWVVDGAGGDSTTFVGDSVCIVNMGTETCVSLDSVYFTDTSFCYIQLPDTICIDWNSSNGNIYNISGALTGNRTLQQGNYYLKFSRLNDALYGNTTWSQPGLYPVMSISGGIPPNDYSPIFSLVGSAYDGDTYMQFNGIAAADYSIGTARSATLNPFTIAEGEDLGGAAGRPMMQFYGVGDSIVMVNNVLAAGSALRIRANTTAAASNTQKGLEVDLKGTSATAAQSTWAGYFSNTHGGTTSVNYGIAGVASTGASSNYGVYGTVSSTNGAGTAGICTSGAAPGIYGQSAAGYAVQGVAAGNSLGSGHFSNSSSNTNSELNVLRIERLTTGTAADGIAGGIQFHIEADNGTSYEAAKILPSWTTAASGTRTSRTTISGVSSTTSNDIMYWEGDKRVRFNGRAEMQQGADVASVAGAITLGSDGNVFEITGTNAITLISNVGWQNGSEVTLFFTSTASLTDGTANSGTDIGMELNGNANFTGSADDSVTLVLSEIGGTQRWREKCRSIN